MRETRNISGAMMMQVLMGLGIMIIMTPLIISQVERHNRNLARKDVVAELLKLQMAASSFISFLPALVKEGCNMFEGVAMTTLLAENGGKEIPIIGKFNQNYYVYICKKDKVIHAMAGAKGGDFTDSDRNSIGEYLFDQGAVVDMDGGILSNYEVKLAPPLVDRLILDDMRNSAVVLVSDGIALTDFLHIDAAGYGKGRNKMPNTMLADLDMNRNGIDNIGFIKGEDVEVAGTLSAEEGAGNTATFDKDSSILKMLEYRGRAFEFEGNDIPIVAKEIILENLKVKQDATAAGLFFSLGNVAATSLRADKIIVKGNMVFNGKLAGFTPYSITAAELNLALTSEFKNIIIAKGGGVKVGDNISIKLDGVSEVDDICWNDKCVSTEILALYAELKSLKEQAGAKGGIKVRVVQ